MLLIAYPLSSKTGELKKDGAGRRLETHSEKPTFLHIHVAPNWMENKFQSTRPGVLVVVQQRVSSE